MPRYFFNVFDGQDVFDKKGVELSDKKAARLHMLVVALEHVEKIENQNHPWQMEALDDDGRIVGVMEFGLEKGEP